MSFESLLPLITLVFGIAGTLGVEWLRSRDTRSREHAARADARSDLLENRRMDFELSALAEVNTQLNRLGRASTRYHLLDLEVATAVKVDYASRRLEVIPGESEIGEELRLANRDASAAVSLILDDDLRAQVEETITHLNNVSLVPRPVDEAARAYDSAVIQLSRAQQSVAGRIRHIYIHRA